MRPYRHIGDYRWGLVATIAGTALVTAFMAPLQAKIGLLNEGLTLLLLTLIIAAFWGWRVGLFAAILTNLSLNFFFVQPLHTFSVQHGQNVFALGVFLVVSLVGGTLLSRARAAAEDASRRQGETEVLLALSRELIGRADPIDALTTLCENVVRAFRAPGAGVLSPAGGAWTVLASSGNDSARRLPDRSEGPIAQRAVETGRLAWVGHTGIAPRRGRRVVAPGPLRGAAEASRGVAFAPLRVGERTLGVLRLDGPIGETPFREQPQQLIGAFAREAALGVQRVELAQAAAHADALRLADEMKTMLMTSISHDLKTPLAGIKAAVSSLLDRSVSWSDDDIRSFLETIDSEADRLTRVISDNLDLNRIESGTVRPVLGEIRARQLLEEAVERTRAVTLDRPVTVDAPNDLAVTADESLVLQALVNLIENATKYSTPGGAVRLSAERTPSGVALIVADEGPGIAGPDLPHVFGRAFRSRAAGSRVRGSGLGLAIVKGFVTLSGGDVQVESAPGGTRFSIILPAAAGVGVA